MNAPQHTGRNKKVVSFHNFFAHISFNLCWTSARSHIVWGYFMSCWFDGLAHQQRLCNRNNLLAVFCIFTRPKIVLPWTSRRRNLYFGMEFPRLALMPISNLLDNVTCFISEKWLWSDYYEMGVMCPINFRIGSWILWLYHICYDCVDIEDSSILGALLWW